ncbi:transcription antitermination factor NusB [Thalassobacillus sp. CUG 92003]|uniref:transcription antitermination factor NusB n=1 Tax=Thalassobacillus sp. CUG 92003 TaxID=2736641 RepID=UPI0015E6EB75|nr:transcription antitermination factor NusB [Thalassobacillus sp. CUG 92003]
MNRRDAREKAFQALFQMDVNDMEPEDAIQHVLDEGDDPFLLGLVHGVKKNRANVDETITDHMENWTISRLPRVERTILRIAVYEMVYNEDIPHEVAINEAVELAKLFGEEKSGSFVNAVLSRINKQ